jgi:hypothetical protein
MQSFESGVILVSILNARNERKPGKIFLSN